MDNLTARLAAGRLVLAPLRFGGHPAQLRIAALAAGRIVAERAVQTALVRRSLAVLQYQQLESEREKNNLLLNECY